jgi:hypothetical protein
MTESRYENLSTGLYNAHGACALGSYAQLESMDLINHRRQRCDVIQGLNDAAYLITRVGRSRFEHPGPTVTGRGGRAFANRPQGVHRAHPGTRPTRRRMPMDVRRRRALVTYATEEMRSGGEQTTTTTTTRIVGHLSGETRFRLL